LEEVVSVVKTIESNQQETAKDVKTLLGSGSVEKNETCRLEDVAKEIKDLKTLLVPAGIGETNETTLEEVANMVKVIALNQQENAKEIRDLKRLLVSVSVKTNETSLDETVVKEIKDDVKAFKILLTTKEALVAALVCEYLVCL